MGADPQTDDVVSEVDRLRVSIDRAAAAIEIAIACTAPAPADDDPEHTELRRQLAALRERVAQAERRNEGPQALRAELATLLCFARTLEADADRRRSALEEQTKQHERLQSAAREQRASRAAEREKLVRHRDALQSTILQTGARMAQQYRGECRRSIPVRTLGEGLTVCSVSVSCPRRGLRFAKQWLVTLTLSHDVLVIRE